MGLIQAKQIEKYLIATVGITGFTSSATATDDITTALTAVLTTAGNGGVSVPLQVGSATAEGVATSVSYNKCPIYLNGVGFDRLRDANDDEVYAKVTNPSAGVWQLDYYTTPNNGVEAAYTFAAATDISIELPYWFTFDNLPADALVSTTERHIAPDAAGSSRQKVETLAATALNTLPDLDSPPVGNVLLFFINGQMINAKQSSSGIAVNATTGAVTVTPVDLGYNITTTDIVTVQYTY